jgi:hypothetical protein
LTADAVYKIQEVTPISSRTDRQVQVDLDIGGQKIETFRYLESFSFDFGSQASWDGKIILFDQDWDYIEALAIQAKAAAGTGAGEVRFRFGWMEESMSEWYLSSLLGYTPTFSQDGATLELNLCKPSIVTSNLENRTASWPANTAPSFIVEFLAPQIRPEYANAAQRIIEPSKPHPYSVHMNNSKPCNWIQEIFCGFNPLVPVESIKGQAGYKFVEGVHDSTGKPVLRFHTDGYQGAAIVSREYVFARGQLGQVLNFSVSDLTTFTLAAGAGRDKNIVTDTLQKKQRESGVSDDGKAGTQQRDPPKIMNVGGDTGEDQKQYRDNRFTKVVTSAYPDAETSRRHAASAFDFLRNSAYTATLEVLGDPFIRYNDFIKMHVLIPDRAKGKGYYRSHYTSGIYRVEKVSHSISMGSFTTTLDLRKAETEMPKVQGKSPSGQDLPSNIPRIRQNP